MKTQHLIDFQQPASSFSEAILFKRILLVESEVRTIQRVREVLDLHFFEVTAVESPVDAIKELIKSDYDVIVCDLTSPDFPAQMFFKAVGRVRAELCQRFISIMDAEVARRQSSLGMLSIWKPLDVRILLEAVQTVLKKEAQSKAQASQQGRGAMLRSGLSHLVHQSALLQAS